MALQKSIDTNFGIPATYWRVIKTELDYLNSQGTVLLSGYISEQSRQENKQHLAVRHFRINSNDFNTYFVPDVINPLDINQVKNSYLYIKNLENSEFADAIDV